MLCKFCGKGILAINTYTSAVNYRGQTQYIEAEIYKCGYCNREQSSAKLVRRNQAKIKEVKNMIDNKE